MEREAEGESVKQSTSFLSQNNLIFSLKQGNLWKLPAYHLAVEVCVCCCGEVSFLDLRSFSSRLCHQGHLRKDLNWVPPINANQSGQGRERRREGSGSEGEKQKRRRQKKSGKNSKPALTIGLPTFGVNGSQVRIRVTYMNLEDRLASPLPS